MGLKSRNKGAAGENEVARIIREQTGINLRRRLSQYQAGGHDLEPTDEQAQQRMGHMAVEIKRLKRITEQTRRRLWKEAVEQAGVSKIPVLIFREDNQPWQVSFVGRMALSAMPGEVVATIAIEDWCALLREDASRP